MTKKRPKPEVVEVLDANFTPLTKSRHRSVRLRSLEDILQEMGRQYRAGCSGRITSSEANGRIWSLRQMKDLVSALDDTEFLQRIEQLEDRLNLRGGTNAPNVRQLALTPRTVGDADE
jgi:hypothetical protein